MNTRFPFRLIRSTSLAAFSLLALVFLSGPSVAQTPPSPWTSSDVIQPEVLAKLLAGAHKPLIFQVGFEFLYKQGHIPGAQHTGAGRDADGIENLKNAVSKVSRHRQIVLYCGCCPWDHCPNVRPAFLAMQQWGFKDVRVLYLPHNFDIDWMQKGYPTEK